MTEEQFIRKNQEGWEKLARFNQLLPRKSAVRLDKEEIREFAGLFRLAGRHLAFAKTHFPDAKTTLYLNQLVGGAHPHFYQKEKSGFQDALEYFGKGFPAAVREKRAYFAAAMFFFVLGAFLSLALISLNDQYVTLFLPEDYIRNINLDSSGGGMDYSLMSAIIMTNNIRVVFLAMALGVTAGLGTVWVLFQNGAIIGALAGLLSIQKQNLLPFWALILPHGILELTAIFLGGAAGLIIGRSLLIPGDRKRKDACIQGAKEAAYFLPGVIVMLILAGLIEGFFTPLPISPWWKLGFALLTLVLIIGYFVRPGIGSPQSE
ncbi:MAG: stage II sporulation protein M [Clostridiales bacterium]|jgi:uncharacterized membrane protein SpoIIM required for sporulation|nr:stage II sporulation protein M [Clostridiales bacterium]